MAKSEQQLDLIKTEHCKVTAVGVLFPKTMSIDEWRNDLASIVSAKAVADNVLPLAIGQMIVYGESTIVPRWSDGRFKNKEDGERLELIISNLDRSIGTVRNWASICRNVAEDVFRRFMPDLTFAHHALVSGMDKDDQIKWLEKAVKNKWNRLDMQEAILKSQADKDPSGLKLDFLPNVTKARIDLLRSLKQVFAMPVGDWAEDQREEIAEELERIEEQIHEYRAKLEAIEVAENHR